MIRGGRRGGNKYYNNYYNQNNGYYSQQYNNNGNHNNQRPHHYENITKTLSNNKDVIKATETGFTDSPDKWFDDNEYFSRLPGRSDLDGKKDYYFNSYSSFHIHEEMLKDAIRTNSYKDAIMKNAETFKDKIVLDIGCGTGVLSIFAAKSGAKHVYGIEFADIADYAKEIVKQNKLEDKVTILKTKVEEAVLPVEKVDIIISEWMGYFLLFESMLDTVLYARDKWLNKDGYILPDKATMTIAAVEDYDYKKSKTKFWNDVYGINMSCIKPTIKNEPWIDDCPSRIINSSTCKIFEIDLYTVKKEELDFASKFELTINRNNDYFSGIVAWFDCYYSKVPNNFTLSTSPFFKYTHWKQTIFYTDKDVEVEKGDVITGSIAVRKSEYNFRNIDVKISFNVTAGGKKDSWYQLYKIA